MRSDVMTACRATEAEQTNACVWHWHACKTACGATRQTVMSSGGAASAEDLPHTACCRQRGVPGATKHLLLFWPVSVDPGCAPPWCCGLCSARPTHGAWRHAGARFLLSGDVWLVLWTWAAAVLARPSVPAGVASKNGRAEITFAGLAAPMAQTSAQL